MSFVVENLSKRTDVDYNFSTEMKEIQAYLSQPIRHDDEEVSFTYSFHAFFFTYHFFSVRVLRIILGFL